MKARELVDARLYDSEEEAVQDAFRHHLRARPELKVQLAVHRYRTEGLSLARAAALAGVSWAQMREIVAEKGVPVRLGPESIEEARQEAETLREFFEAPA